MDDFCLSGIESHVHKRCLYRLSCRIDKVLKPVVHPFPFSQNTVADLRPDDIAYRDDEYYRIDRI